MKCQPQSEVYSVRILPQGRKWKYGNSSNQFPEIDSFHCSKVLCHTNDASP